MKKLLILLSALIAITICNAQSYNYKLKVSAYDENNLEKAPDYFSRDIKNRPNSALFYCLVNAADLRYFQSMLGDESSKTPEIYTYITTKGIDQTKSPLDTMDYRQDQIIGLNFNFLADITTHR